MNKLVRVDDLKQVIKQHDMLAPVYRHELGRHCCNDQLANSFWIAAQFSASFIDTRQGALTVTVIRGVFWAQRICPQI